jgi:hypothetical protein
MKRLVLAASLAFALVGVSCDDDTTTPPADAGGDAAKTDAASTTDSGGPVAGMCTGTFSRLTRGQLKALSAPAGKCSTDADLEFICTGDIATKARECGVTCKTLGAPNLPDCVSKCLQPKTSITSGCTDCYRDLVLCTAINCQECVADPNSAACMTCQVTKGCFASFFTCSGLPSGATPPPVDAAPDAVVDAGGKADATADAKVDAAADAKADGGVDADAAADGGGLDGADAASDGSVD